MKYIVEVLNLTKKYGNVTAVNNISFKVKEGEFFSILGPSGCGKTTILRVIGGFIDQDSGSVIIDGIEMKNVAPNKRNTSMVFQNLALFPHMNVEDNIIYGLKKKRIPSDIIKYRLDNILSVVNLKGLEKRSIYQLSGGQQQRVALARSLIIEPKILLLDEPLASLDKKLRVSMRAELKEIQKKTGTTFLYVTHDQTEALTMSDNIAVMNAGNIIQVGSPEQIYNKPKNIFVADFIGAGNFISIKKMEKTINEKIGYKNILVLTNQGAKIIINQDLNNIFQSKEIYFFIRPEKIKISFYIPNQQMNNNIKDKSNNLQYNNNYHINYNNQYNPINHPLYNDKYNPQYNVFSGKIISKTFEGPDTRIKINIDNLGILTAEIKNSELDNKLTEGNKIYAYWSINDGILLSSDI